MARHFLIVAGEISGDQHGAPLMQALAARDQEIRFWGLGGNAMSAEGLECLYHVKDLSVTGFLEVIKHLRFFRRVMTDIIEACKKNPPEAAILIDYPGFNLRLGMRLKAMGIPVYYYISPQVWAWKKGRIKTMRQFIKRMFVIFPFEEAFFQSQGIPVTFTGHPLVEKDFALPDKRTFCLNNALDPDRPLVAILPGSRRNELEKHVRPVKQTILLLAAQFPNVQFAIAGLQSLAPSYYADFEGMKDVHLVMDTPYPLMAHADVALVASGTASLETAFLGTPLVVFYRIAPLSYLIGKMLVDIDHLAMPNLILGERAIPELIQHEARPRLMARELARLLSNPDAHAEMRSRLARLQQALGAPGCAPMIADIILKELQQHGA